MPVLAICVIVLAALHGGRPPPHRLRPLGDRHRPEPCAPRAFAGIPVERIRFLTYVLSALLAALCGYLFSGFSGGSSLSMGEQYLLASIAVVVIGGTSVAGGNGNLPGLWGAALFLFLVQSMLNTYPAPAPAGRDRPHHHRRHHRRGRAEAAPLSLAAVLEHDPEKWVPVFGKDHAPTIDQSGMTIRRKVIAL